MWKNLDRVPEIGIWNTVAAYRRLKSLSIMSIVTSSKEKNTKSEKLCIRQDSEKFFSLIIFSMFIGHMSSLNKIISKCLFSSYSLSVIFINWLYRYSCHTLTIIFMKFRKPVSLPSQNIPLKQTNKQEKTSYCLPIVKEWYLTQFPLKAYPLQHNTDFKTAGNLLNYSTCCLSVLWESIKIN